jgi:phospholipid/cholesterol/gamma-HCH transport system substrate-binding protein
VQIVGRLDVDEVIPKKRLGDKPYPEIREGASFLEATSTSAQELLSKAGTTVDRLNELLSEDNLNAFSETMKNVSIATGSFAKQDANIQKTLAELPQAIAEFHQTFAKLDKLSNQVDLMAMELGPQDTETRKALAGKEPGELAKTVKEARAALVNIDGAAGQLNKLLTSTRAPIQEFSQTGLNELSLAIHELRELTANLNIIATKLERDPAGFVFSGKQGYTPK